MNTTETVKPGAVQMAKPEAALRTSVYVVQRRWRDHEPQPKGTLWEDIGTVEVPHRTQRKTVIERALAEFEVPESSHPSVFRALNEDAVEEILVRVEQPPAPPPVVKVG